MYEKQLASKKYLTKRVAFLTKLVHFPPLLVYDGQRPRHVKAGRLTAQYRMQPVAAHFKTQTQSAPSFAAALSFVAVAGVAAPLFDHIHATVNSSCC